LIIKDDQCLLLLRSAVTDTGKQQGTTFENCVKQDRRNGENYQRKYQYFNNKPTEAAVIQLKFYNELEN